MKENNRGGFTSNFGALMAVAGSAVGLGNIWRFSYLAGENGGAAFIIIYVILAILIGLPLILSEYIIGKSSRGGAIKAFSVLSPYTKWKYSGYISIVIGFLILGFYSVVAGWTIKYLYDSVVEGFAGQSAVEIKASFDSFTSSAWQSVAFGALFVLLTAYIISRGIEKGVEKWNKVLMPMLFVMLVLLCINSMTLDGWSEAISFMFSPDWSEVTSTTLIEALGQAFFSLSVGMGVIITYASYDHNKDNMVKSKGMVLGIDIAVAILSGVAIFPAVFTFGLTPGEGPGLVFVTLPNVFAQLPFGRVLASLFFSMLVIASVTSAISITEMLVTFFIEQFKLSRAKATVIITIMVLVLTVMCAMSQQIFDLFDNVSANYLMPIGGLIAAVFVGWVMKREQTSDTFTTGGLYAKRIFPIFIFLVRYVAPIAIAFIILGKVGLI